MTLQPRRPPGHAKRKALVFAADIVNLRKAGHSLVAIREALEDAGLVVSVSTVRREVLKAVSVTGAGEPAAVALPMPEPPRTGARDNAVAHAPAGVPAAPPPPIPAILPLQGRAVAEAFMQGRPTNTLFLKEPKP